MDSISREIRELGLTPDETQVVWQCGLYAFQACQPVRRAAATADLQSQRLHEQLQIGRAHV